MALSTRGQLNVDTVIPRIPRTILEAGNTGEDETHIIDMSVAENWLIRDAIIDIERQAVEQALLPEHFSWPKGFWGDPELLKILASFINKHFSPHEPVTDKHISLMPGVAHALDALFFNICNPGDGILCPAPYWNGYDTFCRLRAAAVPVLVDIDSLDDEASFLGHLEEAYARGNAEQHPIKALALSNPHNPLGRCFSRATLEACARFCEAKDIHFVSDEVFGPFTFSPSSSSSSDQPAEAATAAAAAATSAPAEPSSLSSAAFIRPFTSVLALDLGALGVDAGRVHVAWGPSKVFALAGARIGCTVTQGRRADMRNALTLASFTNVSALSVLLLKQLLTSPRLPEIVQAYQARSALAYAHVTAFLRRLGIPYSPCNTGPFIMAKLAPRATSWQHEADVIARLREKGVWVSPGRSHHLPDNEMGWARITFALTPDTLERGLARIEEVLTASA